jgi:hypothetical protein
MHRALTLCGQLTALAADLNPQTGGSAQWGVSLYAPAQNVPTQNFLFRALVRGREYSIHDIAALMPDKSRSALRCALAAMIRNGRLACRKSQAGGLLLYSLTRT